MWRISISNIVNVYWYKFPDFSQNLLISQVFHVLPDHSNPANVETIQAILVLSCSSGLIHSSYEITPLKKKHWHIKGITSIITRAIFFQPLIALLRIKERRVKQISTSYNLEASRPQPLLSLASIRQSWPSHRHYNMAATNANYIVVFFACRRL